MKLFRLKYGKYLPNLVAIDPGAVAAPVLDKNSFLLFLDDVVTGAGSTESEHVRLERNSGEGAAVRVELTPDTLGMETPCQRRCLEVGRLVEDEGPAG